MKTAVVTGASTGIGKRVSIELAKKGYHVFLLARNNESLKEVVSLIESLGGRADAIVTDLLSRDSIFLSTKTIISKTNQIDLLANIAGMYHDKERHFFDIPFEEYPDHAIIENITSILIGHILLTKHLSTHFAYGASVINMSGTFDEGEIGVISDFITKKGMELFSKQLVLELEHRNIRSNAVRPGFMYTENVQKFFPNVKPTEALDPDAVAKIIVEIAEDKTLNGIIEEIKA